MGSYSIGEALNLLLERSEWKPKINEIRLREEWETIVGKTIARYTRSIDIRQGRLTIYTDVAQLKHELQMGREQLLQKINEYFKERIITEIIIK